MPFFFISMSFLSHSWVGMVGFVVGVIVWLVVYKRTPAETWSDRVCKILMEYQQPFDEQAYQVLLKKIKEDTAGRVDIVAWLKAEEKLVRRLDRPSIEKELIDSRLQDNGASK